MPAIIVVRQKCTKNVLLIGIGGGSILKVRGPKVL